MKATKYAALGWAIILVCSGCYMRRPLETTSPAASTRIVADLTDAGTVAMGNALGSGVLQIEGVVTTASDEAWTLQMLRAEHRDGRSIGWNRELVSFPRTALTNASIIVLDKKRSYLAAAGITLGAFVLANAFNLLGASEEDDNTTPPAQSWVPGGRK